MSLSDLGRQCPSEIMGARLRLDLHWSAKKVAGVKRRISGVQTRPLQQYSGEDSG